MSLLRRRGIIKRAAVVAVYDVTESDVESYGVTLAALAGETAPSTDVIESDVESYGATLAALAGETAPS